jgi:hypothetical protein
MLLGPSTANVDFSLTKEIPFHLVGEGGRWEFRAEVFNLLNRTNFFLPVGVGRSGARVFTADDRRPSLDAVANPTPISTAGAITRTITTARQIQLALKLVF